MTEFLLLLLQLPWFLLKAAVIIIGWSTLFYLIWQGIIDDEKN
jgi:hypothetical protein|tara:strand:+ start:719 stop:847 length:129 start_codon:yes stop_codon:yes gene_type:complete